VRRLVAVLTEQDTVPVQPKAFGLPTHVIIKDALNKKWVVMGAFYAIKLCATMSDRAVSPLPPASPLSTDANVLAYTFQSEMLTHYRYANRLVPDRGLALCVYDIITAEDGKVTWGNGLMYYKGESGFREFRS
jgi:hypothetical protein